MPPKPKFPAKLYITIENQGTDEEYLSASKDPTDGLVSDAKTLVAEYRHFDTRIGKLVPEFD